MARTKATWPFETLGDLFERLGGIDPSRVKLHPSPGLATKRDLINYYGPGQYELVDHVLVAKALCPFRGYLAAAFVVHLGDVVEREEAGFMCGPGGWVEVAPGVIRNPDVSFFSWERFPERRIQMVQISSESPDLAVEILGRGNTRKEMAIKLKEYFRSGVALVWVVNPETHTAESYTSPEDKTAIAANGTLDGGNVLPGFQLPLAKLFEKFPPTQSKKPKRKKK
jgi:Uma2 family endonuclease